MVSLGAVSYGIIAVLAEGGFRLFYTLSLIGKDKQRRERELAEVRAEGIAEERKRWQQWTAARDQAAAEGREFNEPPPGD